MRPASVSGIVTGEMLAHLPQYTLFALHKFCISIVFNFLWDNCHTQEKGKTEVMQWNFWGQTRCITGDVQMVNNFSLSL